MTSQNNNKTTRRRGKQDRQQEEKEQVEPMDEVEQDKEIELLRIEAYEQMDLMHNVFSRICEGAMFLCLILGVASQDLWCWIHVVGGIFLHWGATRIVASSRPTQEDSGLHQILPFVALVVVAAVFAFQYIRKEAVKNDYVDDQMHHMALALSNAVTMLAALYLRWDCQSTQQQISQLEKSKYRYKSL
ncbi:expressed unknown protein [Seminavis robusta]|uniref:Transmembrane protein n=1 Tax=Seminavis robusta TaxID=568900 RepID=A0A9N8DR16_9STRA|nr:expressed unknown protein [Seminavis robusta]|eukprot:Sro294_g110210.1 n/a (188) ;mRNA; f:29421-29984